MERVIAGRFQTKYNAHAVAALIARYIDTTEIRILHNNPPGRLVGAMTEQGVYDDKGRAQERRPGGVMLSVRTANPVSEDRVIATLRAAGAADIEQDQGEWHNGEWAIFNPAAAPRLVQRPSI